MIKEKPHRTPGHGTGHIPGHSTGHTPGHGTGHQTTAGPRPGLERRATREEREAHIRDVVDAAPPSPSPPPPPSPSPSQEDRERTAPPLPERDKRVRHVPQEAFRAEDAGPCEHRVPDPGDCPRCRLADEDVAHLVVLLRCLRRSAAC
ncbi:hypothetical protein E0500_010810 [Streptomyces sp. KM273126]|uniref:hypothetical protein n=1 Tax=Streptomyces sp. KM273126 TaxID=2545247 RepID=UPI00103DFF32|nr:hypothetical protein [Streptomyces sp. KM273126]MBA2807888.1 hypothetical protein [Streptomyces sp. KM273126]